MPYHSHKLNSISHSHIIERTDPITGDSVKENDSVVFCAICKSCFLEDSWIYMNEQHCGQDKTLDATPTLPSKLIAKKNTTQLITELLSTNINFNLLIPSTMLPFFATLFFISATKDSLSVDLSFSLTLWAGALGGILASITSAIPKFRFLTGNHSDDVRIFRNYIELGRQRIYLKKIRQIKYQREVYVERVDMKEYYSSIVPCILVYFDNGRFIKKNLSTKDYKKTATFLKGLEKISYFKEVFFYSENKTEYEIMQHIQSKSNGNIVIGEPNRLFHDL